MTKGSKPTHSAGGKRPSLVLRTCIGCRTVDEKGNFLRLAMQDNNEVVIDKEAVRNGRGAYVCNLECLKRALQEKKISRAFKGKVKTNQLVKLLRANT